MIKQLGIITLLCLLLSAFATLAKTDLDALKHLLRDSPNQALTTIEQQLTNTTKASSATRFQLHLLYVDALIKVGKYQSAKQHISELHTTLKSVQQPNQQSMLLLRHANLLQSQNKIAEAADKLNEILALDPQDELVIADVYSNLSHVYRLRADYKTARAHAERAITIAEQHQDDSRLASFYNQLGIALDYMGKIELALNAHEQSLQKQRTLNNQQGISNSLYNIAELYRDLEELERALSYFRQALKVDLTLGNPRHIANSYGKVGQVLLQLGQHTEAKSNIEKGLALTREMQADSDTAWQLSNLVNVQLALGEQEQALSHAKEALELAVNSGAKRTERAAKLSLANAYLAMAQPQLAKTQLEQLLEAPQLATQMRSAIHKQLSEIFSAQANYQAAFEHLQLFQQQQDELRRVGDEKKALKMAENIELVKQEQALTILQKEQKLQQAQLQNLELQRKFSVAMLLLVLAAMASYYWRQRQKAKYKALEQRLTQQSLEQKNQLLADISHELRTPLTSLRLSVEALLFNIEPDPERAYRKIESKVKELDTLISDIYQSAQYDNNVMTLEFSKCEISQLLSDACEELRPLFASKSQTLHCSLTNSNITLCADPQRLKQVFLNLLRNSHFYTHEQGQCHVSLNTDDSQVIITILDSSPGVANEELNLIFERLYRCESSRSRDHGGSGLGLAICKQIITAHQGQIKAEQSNLGGLLVEIRLPLS
ncbi:MULTISPECIES: tetratricopeptide repeat protein [unclassified Pseudoalteromonas]|uniref:tetratricopeptide repeat protein n=1 Tax=unclassified Pseudoalteromonas TaxID=194690 RepID=UPI003014FC83